MVVAAIIVGAIQYVCVKLLATYLKDLYLALAAGLAGFILFWCGLLLARDFGEEELSVIPFGGLLYSLGQMLGVF